jgi:hypothetical protein
VLPPASTPCFNRTLMSDELRLPCDKWKARPVEGGTDIPASILDYGGSFEFGRGLGGGELAVRQLAKNVA